MADQEPLLTIKDEDELRRLAERMCMGYIHGTDDAPAFVVQELRRYSPMHAAALAVTFAGQMQERFGSKTSTEMAAFILRVANGQYRSVFEYISEQEKKRHE